jgi:hypothetical protein
MWVCSKNVNIYFVGGPEGGEKEMVLGKKYSENNG